MLPSSRRAPRLKSTRCKKFNPIHFINPALLIVLIFAVPRKVSADSQPDFAAQMAARMPGLLARYDVPGAVAAYIQNGAVTWTQAYGVSNLSTGEAMRPGMLFNFGSCGKVLTAWGVMRLVEQGQLDLDAPVNQYLKRWKITSDQFDPQGVTLRRILSHTSGLTVHGFADYGSRRTLPSLVQVLDGQNQMGGKVVLQWQPGSRFQYSGGGYTILQMVIEDVTGEPFESFMQEQVSAPLGLSSLHWTWTPELQKAAAIPYGSQSEPVGYRQLASLAIGSEVSTVTDFARFVAAAVEGPNGEPVGRDVLQPDSLRQMFQVQANTQATEGLGYGIAQIAGDKLLMHFGSNPGWNSFFILDLDRREGLVFATNSSNGFELTTAVEDLWAQSVLGYSTNVYPPLSDKLGLAGRVSMGIAGVFGLALLVTLLIFLMQLKLDRRRFFGSSSPFHWLLTLPWLLLGLFWWYWIYAPFQVLLPSSFPDIWPLPQTALVLGILLGWVLFSLVTIFFPKVKKVGS